MGMDGRGKSCVEIIGKRGVTLKSLSFRHRVIMLTVLICAVVGICLSNDAICLAGGGSETAGLDSLHKASSHLERADDEYQAALDICKKVSNKRLLRYKAEPGRELRYRLVREARFHDTDVRRAPRSTARIDRAILRVTKWAPIKEGIEFKWSVQHVDEGWKPLPKKPRGVLRRFFEFADRLDLRGRIVYPPDLPKDYPGPADYFPAPAIFPTLPEARVAAGDSWREELQLIVNPGGPDDRTRFPLKVEYKLEGYEEKLGYDCARISYTYEGKFDPRDYPDRFDPATLVGRRSLYSISGHGKAYFAHAEGFLVENQEHVERIMRGQKLMARGDERVWEITQEEITEIDLTMSLEK